MIYRPEQKLGRGRSGEVSDSGEESLNAFYKRKQSVKHNRVASEAPVMHDKDRDAEQDESKWEGAGPKKTTGTHFNEKSSTIWDED